MRHRIVPLAVVALAACGEGVPTPVVPPPPAADLRLSCQPAAFAAGAGCATSGCSITGLNGFAGSVTLSCAGQPAGLSCAFGPHPLPVSGDRTAVTGFLVSADWRVPPQVHTFEVAASGGGLRRTVTVQVQTGPVPQPSAARDTTFVGCAGYAPGVLGPTAALRNVFVGAWAGAPGPPGTLCDQTLSASDGSFVLQVSPRCAGEGQPLHLTAGGLATCLTPPFERGSTTHVTLLGRPGGGCS